jgi:hypothetical protein
MTLSEQVAQLRGFLRQTVKTLRDEGIAIPVPIADWWREEQKQMAAEEAREDAAKEARRLALTEQIQQLQQELDSIR